MRSSYTVLKETYKSEVKETYIPLNISLDNTSQEVNKLIPSEVQYGGSGDKGKHHHDYLVYYEYLLERFKNKNFKMLEIGISHGYSLVTWLKHYKNINLVAVDIDLNMWNNNKQKFNLSQSDKNKIRIIEHDATQKSFLSLIKDDTFDVILDDGSHKTSDMISSFELLFPTKLNSGGIYIIEDVHCDGEMKNFLEYAKNILPYTYKFDSFDNCSMLSGREEIQKRINSNWKYQIKEIIFHRDIVVITKE